MQLYSKPQNLSLNRDLLIFTSLLFVYSLIFTYNPTFISEFAFTLSIFPVLTFAWLQGKKAAVFATIFVIPLNFLLNILLTQNPFQLIFSPPFIIFTFAELSLAVFIGHLHTLTIKLNTEIAKRKQLQLLLEEKNSMCDSLLTQNSRLNKRANAELENQIVSIKSSLEKL